jgi:hypothetical protein
MKFNRAFTIPVLISTMVGGACGNLQSAAGNTRMVAQASDDSTRLVGTWRYSTSDANTSEKISLVLRDDGTYTKTLDAKVNGVPYGGTHSGKWTARGLVVSLSGDGNWPPYTHDLARFQKD